MKTKEIKNYNLSNILKPYKNKWVALSLDNKKVISSGNTLKDAALKAKRKDVVFMKAFPNAFYAPVAL